MNVIFLSVRTGSSRLPKKALYEIQGKTTIEYLIDRLKQSKYAEKIILCTTKLKDDDILCDIAEKNDIDYFRGSSEDKLSRWLGATKAYDVDFFVNVDGDDLFFDAGLADICFQQNNFEYWDNNHLDFIDGQGNYNDVYAMSAYGLGMVCESKQSDETEFIKPFFYDIAKSINIEKLINVPDKYKKKKMRLTLDYKEDFEFFKNVIEHFLDNSKEMEFEDIITYIEENPEVSAINWHREQDWKENQERSI
jgi:spore coat polysaccharide biosynthesis protein SpsF